jgi:hypothetical protein
MSIFGDVVGLVSGGRAAKAAGDANIAAEHGVLNATKAGQDQLAGAGVTANQTIQDMLAKQQGNTDPYVQGGAQGEQALTKYALSNPQFDPTKANDFFNTPAYKFQLEQGTNAIENSSAARGTGASGATLKALTDYGQGLASTYYQQAFNNAQSTFQTNQNTTLANLGALTGTGEFGVSQSNTALGNAGREMSGNDLTVADLGSRLGLAGSTTAGNFAVGAGNARAAGILGQGNSLAGLVGDVAGLGGKLAGLPGF